MIWNHSFGAYANLSAKLTFITPWYVKIFLFGEFCASTRWITPILARGSSITEKDRNLHSTQSLEIMHK